LAGGRIDLLANRPVATIVYLHQGHFINEFVWPAASRPIDFDVQSHQGYSLCGWNKSGLNYLIVSELSQADIEKFEDQLRDRTEIGRCQRGRGFCELVQGPWAWRRQLGHHTINGWNMMVSFAKELRETSKRCPWQAANNDNGFRIPASYPGKGGNLGNERSTLINLSPDSGERGLLRK
jgi:hypothetical protein